VRVLEPVAAFRPHRSRERAEREQGAVLVRGDLEVGIDALPHWALHALRVDGALPFARRALDVHDAGAPLRIVLVIRDEGEHVGARTVDDDAVLRGGHPLRAYSATRARAKSSGSNGRKSSRVSPTPISLTGSPSSCAIATAMPPLALPSSFVSATPVTPTASPNSRACCSPF